MKRIEKSKIRLDEDEIINYKRLDSIIKKIEKIIISDEEMDYVEQKLLYDILLDRRIDRINQIKMNDNIGNMNFGNIIKRVMKGGNKDELDN